MTLYALAGTYWLHMVATLAWVLALALQGYKAPQTAEQLRLAERATMLGWLALMVLAGSGMFQMSSHPSYAGFLDISSAWAAAILIKHLAIFLCVGLGVINSLILLPQMRRAQWIARADGGAQNPAGDAATHFMRLARWNLALTIVILALTALARVSG